MRSNSSTMPRARVTPLRTSAGGSSGHTSSPLKIETQARVDSAAKRLDRVRQQHTRNPDCVQTYIRYLELNVEYLRAELRATGVAV